MQRDLGREIRENREAIAALIRAEVDVRVEDLADRARRRLDAEVDRLVAEIGADLRRRLRS